ncbi:hypothetical protein FOIG_07027 [Fusarium odoratissimum NRRL 54006]|uniref:Uncharacterized protein n=1 Tax=Fusarium odoratissimum (strain NRRL 54006) TaxID=1089451 RepID=X0KXE5_FUSO5|nr:uncharacterized protein FOIG_07027 [Fusarium odoratissimum NRRL 54006]EXM01410.1 hypothetical protein FOIG_07027 [Fusarium odoratissimum NRRL 54006]
MSDSKEVMEEFELPRQSGLIGVYREQEQDIDINVSVCVRVVELDASLRLWSDIDNETDGMEREEENRDIEAGNEGYLTLSLNGEPGRWAPGARCKVKIDRDQTKDDV